VSGEMCALLGLMEQIKPPAEQQGGSPHHK
jgi:hypothetical protein